MKFKVGDIVRYNSEFSPFEGLTGKIVLIDKNLYSVKILNPTKECWSGAGPYRSFEDQLELDQSWLNEQEMRKLLGVK